MAQQHEPDGDAVHKDKLPPVQLQNVKKDALLGEVCQDFYSVLKKHCGRCHKMDLCLDLRVSDSKNGASPSDTKIGTLHIVLDGLTVELRQIPAAARWWTSRSRQAGRWSALLRGPQHQHHVLGEAPAASATSAASCRQVWT